MWKAHSIKEKRAKTVWLRIRIICSSGATYPWTVELGVSRLIDWCLMPTLAVFQPYCGV